MTAPRRIQRRRTAGWRMPEGAVYVGRPSLWKNPYKVVTSRESGALVVIRINKWGEEDGQRWGGFTTQHTAAAFAVDLFHRMILGAIDRDRPIRERYLAPLVGRDLACWCPLDQPCHADVLLKLANAEVPR